MAQTLEELMAELGLNPKDYVALECPNPSCVWSVDGQTKPMAPKPLICRPDAAGTMHFDDCPCGFRMPTDSSIRLFLFALSVPPYFALIHRDDLVKVRGEHRG